MTACLVFVTTCFCLVSITPNYNRLNQQVLNGLEQHTHIHSHPLTSTHNLAGPRCHSCHGELGGAEREPAVVDARNAVSGQGFGWCLGRLFGSAGRRGRYLASHISACGLFVRPRRALCILQPPCLPCHGTRDIRRGPGARRPALPGNPYHCLRCW